MNRLSRRECLVLGAAAGLAGCAPVARRFGGHEASLPLPAGNVHPAVRLLCRAGFGPTPGDVARVTATGHDSYLAGQLTASRDEDLGLKMQLHRLDVLQLDDPETEDLPQGEIIRQLQQAAILRAVHGNNQLLERMVDFWSNHFNVYARKGDAAFRLGTDQREVIRSNALGTFPNLLRASTRSAAMLAFLDNTQNLRSHPNENYARELMELHTLGIGGGYTQRDVQEVARCFTGVDDRGPVLEAEGQAAVRPGASRRRGQVGAGARHPGGRRGAGCGASAGYPGESSLNRQVHFGEARAALLRRGRFQAGPAGGGQVSRDGGRHSVDAAAFVCGGRVGGGAAGDEASV